MTLCSHMKTSFTEAKCDEEQGGASLHNSSSQLLIEDPRAQARTRSQSVVGFAAVLCVSLVAVMVVAVVTFKLLFSPADPPAPKCPEDWIHFGRKCYLFSQADGDWATGRTNCSSLGASLVEIHTQADLWFLMERKSSKPHWIGLQRELGQPWKWMDGTALNSSLFQVSGNGYCAYLNPHPNSSKCLVPMNWICSQPDRQAEQHPNQALWRGTSKAGSGLGFLDPCEGLSGSLIALHLCHALADNLKSFCRDQQVLVFPGKCSQENVKWSVLLLNSLCCITYHQTKGILFNITPTGETCEEDNLKLKTMKFVLIVLTCL